MPNNPTKPNAQILRWRKRRQKHGIGINKPRRKKPKPPRYEILKNIFWTDEGTS